MSRRHYEGRSIGKKEQHVLSAILLRTCFRVFAHAIIFNSQFLKIVHCMLNIYYQIKAIYAAQERQQYQKQTSVSICIRIRLCVICKPNPATYKIVLIEQKNEPLRLNRNE